MREALRKLQAEDLIVVSAGNALTVKVLSEKQLFEIYYTREALEGMAARLAAENASQVDLANLRAVLNDIEDAFDRANPEQVRNFTGEFQLAVFRAAHNDYLQDLLKTLHEKIRNHRTTTMSLAGRDKEVVTFLPGPAAPSEEAQSRRNRADRPGQPAPHLGTSAQDDALRHAPAG